jgi:nitrate/nitrite-specific signal transduction histidine kinase
MELSEQVTTDPILPASQAFHLLQIIQEAIINAIKHSSCSQITVLFKATKEWNVIISDNGTGISEQAFQKKDGNGLSNMSIRAEESGWKIYWKENVPYGTSVTIESGTTN